LEQSASACHVRTLSVCFSGSFEDLSLLAFLPVTSCSARAVTVVIFGHFNRSFYLLTYLDIIIEILDIKASGNLPIKSISFT